MSTMTMSLICTTPPHPTPKKKMHTHAQAHAQTHTQTHTCTSSCVPQAGHSSRVCGSSSQYAHNTSIRNIRGKLIEYGNKGLWKLCNYEFITITDLHLANFTSTLILL